MNGGEPSAGDASAAPHAPGENTLRLRTRPPRRRRRPPLIAAPAADDDATAAPLAETGETPAPAPPGPRLGPDGQPLRRRRRRRRPPQFGSAGDNPAAEAAAAATAASETGDPVATAPARRPPRRRNQRPSGEHQTAEGAPRQDRPQRGHRDSAPHGPRDETARSPRTEAARGPRDETARGDRNRRDSDRRRDGPRDRRDGRDRGDRRGRDGERRVERKLYTLDAVVDRGFQDVEDESGARRVHWTIVKRTVADQVSRKPMSQNYVLQREGVDSEFPSLGAARNAVNKTIVHPEKLTLSKAEHAAQKNGR